MVKKVDMPSCMMPLDTISCYTLEVRFQESPQRGLFYEKMHVPPLEVPVLRQADILVVGGGTFGATCAGAAGREGAKTVLLELCPGLGGTLLGLCLLLWAVLDQFCPPQRPSRG
jgi:hypothetical protein